MSSAEREATRKRLGIWKEAGPWLEEQRWRELHQLTAQRALWMTKALLSRQIGCHPRRDSMGLVEQQALFQRTRQQ